MSTPTRPMVRTSSGWTSGDWAPDGRVMVRPLDRRAARGGRRVHRRGVVTGAEPWLRKTPDHRLPAMVPTVGDSGGGGRGAAIEACNPAMNGMSTVCPD